MKILTFLAFLFPLCEAALAQTQAVLPNGMTQFTDGNGAPYAGGKVYMYIPGTTSPKTTYQDPYGTAPNFNPIALDANGRGIIWGSGVYRQVLQDQYGVTIWDQSTYAPPIGGAMAAQGYIWYGSANGTSNAITLTGSGFTQTDGQTVAFLATSTNTGNTTINASGVGSIVLEKNTSSGLATMTGGEVVIGTLNFATYSATVNAFILQGTPTQQQIASGTVSMFAFNSCPSGWLQNNGAAVSRTGNSALFAAIGTTFGVGDGSTTFNLPNDQGYFWRSWNGTGAGIDPSRGFGTEQGNAVATTSGTLGGTVSGTVTGTTTFGTQIAQNAASLSLGAPGGALFSFQSITGNVTGTASVPLAGGSVSVGSGSDTRPSNIAFISCVKK